MLSPICCLVDTFQSLTDNGRMVIHGRVVNGVVVFEQGVTLPEGAKATVVVEGPRTPGQPDDEKRRVAEALARIDALPDENPGDTFSGADHDIVL